MRETCCKRQELGSLDNITAIDIHTPTLDEVYAEFFSQPFPARSAVAVKALPKGALVEVECIAAK